MLFISHGGHIPAANTAAQRGVAAMAGSVYVATTAALAAKARGRVPLAEGAAGFVAANQEIGGGAALHTGEDQSHGCSSYHGEKLLLWRSTKPKSVSFV